MEIKEINEMIDIIQKYYFEKRDINKLFAYLEHDISIIGSAEHEISHNYDEVVKNLLAEKNEYGDGFVIDFEEINTVKLSENFFLSFGKFKANPNIPSSIAPFTNRFTLIGKIINHNFKLIHVHFSKADDSLNEFEYYPKVSSLLSNKELKGLINEITSELKKRNEEIESLINNIPGGVLCYINDMNFPILSMSNNFYTLCGYTKKEIKEFYHNNLLEMIYEPDRSLIESADTNNKSIDLSYRMCCKNGELIWILEKGQILYDSQGRTIVYSILIDITTRKAQQEELRLLLERHQLIMNQTTDIIFEWDFIHDNLNFSPNWYKKFGYEPITDKASNKLMFSQNIHKDDREIFVALLNDMLAGIPYCEKKFRIKDSKGNYLWHRVRTTNQFDLEGKPIRAVGVLIDIDHDFRENQILIERAEHDSLTRLYNKIAIQSKVQKHLKHHKTEPSALMIIDVDNFKSINDHYGHLYGDTVLSDVSLTLKKAFKSSELIGRIGGDEFLVFLPKLSDIDQIREKANIIMKAFNSIRFPDNDEKHLSCSVGISLFPLHASDYTSLARCADRALYQVKNGSKNNIAIYDPSLGEDFNHAIKQTALNATIDSEENRNVDKELASYTFSMLYHSLDVKTAINAMLEIVGRAYDVSRVYIFESSQDGLSCENTFEWCSEGIIPKIDHLGTLSYEEDLGGYLSNFQNNIFYCQDITTLNPVLNKFLSNLDIVSLLQCAIVEDHEMIGFIGFDECRNNRYWTKNQINSLTLIANILSTFLINLRLKERIKKLEKTDK